MRNAKGKSTGTRNRLEKKRTGIAGLDEVTFGGVPKGRPTLVAGGAGSGKTLLGIEFLVHGAVMEGEPGVFVAFEESADDLAKNVASIGFDLKALEREKKLIVDHIHVDPAELHEAGDFDLSGLFIRLEHAINSIGAKRIVLDTIEVLFSGFKDHALIRAELARLFRWLKAKKVTALITAEKGEGTLSRYGLEEYVSDCVLFLDHRIIEEVSTRRLRVVKYRGSAHGTNEYPFIIEEDGISVLPITSLKLEHAVSAERVSTGVGGLDQMFFGAGYFRGSSILVSGTPGTGKSSMAAHFVDATCAAGERALYFAFEESPAQILRNMRSIGIDLERWVKKGRLAFAATRPTIHGLEMHLLLMHREIERFAPRAVVVDPINNLVSVGELREVKLMFMRLIDFLKLRQMTAFLTSLSSEEADASQLGLSSLMDTWLQLRTSERGGERVNELFIMKSRGMAHSHTIRHYRITNNGLRLEKPSPILQ